MVGGCGQQHGTPNVGQPLLESEGGCRCRLSPKTFDSRKRDFCATTRVARLYKEADVMFELLLLATSLEIRKKYVREPKTSRHGATSHNGEGNLALQAAWKVSVEGERGDSFDVMVELVVRRVDGKMGWNHGRNCVTPQEGPVQAKRKVASVQRFRALRFLAAFAATSLWRVFRKDAFKQQNRYRATACVRICLGLSLCLSHCLPVCPSVCLFLLSCASGCAKSVRRKEVPTSVQDERKPKSAPSRFVPVHVCAPTNLCGWEGGRMESTCNYTTATAEGGFLRPPNTRLFRTLRCRLPAPSMRCCRLHRPKRGCSRQLAPPWMGSPTL